VSILKKISAMLQGPAAGKTPDKECEKLAAAALMVEVAAHDGEVLRVERERILHLLEHRLGLSQEEALELFVEALAAQSEANHILGFTRRIKDHFDDAGREHILELMWEVVFADGKEDAYESNLMRRVAGLLYISDLRSGQIRKTVQVRHAD
tara:strand:+ start:674 stop:1129 length:456 start_codon:yes stop_codon:yes gene_type:complete